MQYNVQKAPPQVILDTAMNLRALRRSQKLSQAALADRSGVSLGSLKRFERTGKISFESLLKLAHVLGRLTEFESLFVMRDDLARIEKLFSDKTRR